VSRGVDADLYDGDGDRIGRHTTGPTWEYPGGTRVSGAQEARLPLRDNAAWLLLRARSGDNRGTLSRVDYIQRLNTVGGLPPAGQCDGRDGGREFRAPYTADYYFYGRPE